MVVGTPRLVNRGMVKAMGAPDKGIKTPMGDSKGGIIKTLMGGSKGDTPSKTLTGDSIPNRAGMLNPSMRRTITVVKWVNPWAVVTPNKVKWANSARFARQEGNKWAVAGGNNQRLLKVVAPLLKVVAPLEARREVARSAVKAGATIWCR